MTWRLGYGKICGMGNNRNRRFWEKALAIVSAILVLVAFLALYAWVSIATGDNGAKPGRYYGLFGIEL